jgi:alkanesulfonate monooxygenase SsuD/methylene tetrahydromethanopterin reductase-like flavin-dependent oxidoreductase (luciferase family)
MLAALAQHTSKVRLSALVTGNTYRNPALLAKTITTLDHVSHGRATLGIGCGWFELEHSALGFEFGTFSERFEKLDEALQIIAPMLRGEPVTLDGKYYKTENAVNSPPTVSRVPIMIGGGGEKKTLRTVARYADMWNAFGTADVLRHKDGVLRQHCTDVGRDEAAIERTVGCKIVIRDDPAEARAVWARQMANNRTPESGWDGPTTLWIGTPEQVAAEIRSRVEVGFETVIVELPAPFDVETMERLIGEVKPLVDRG